MLYNRLCYAILRLCTILTACMLFGFLLSNRIDVGKTASTTRQLQDEKVSMPRNVDEVFPCGEVCSYSGKYVRKGIAYPQLHKEIDCVNIMRRMAYRDHQVIYPPPKYPPEDMVAQFTMNGAMPISEQWYLNENWTDVPRRFQEIEFLVVINKLLRTGENVNMYKDGICVQETLANYKHDIEGQWGVVIGTQLPWLECILLAYGARNVTTLEYAELLFEYPQLETYTPYTFAENFLAGKARQFDFAASFSSIEHSGLGRYTDPLNPFGDLEAMAQVWCMLKPGGMFAVGVPFSKNNSDYISWNAHRMYGTRRLKHLTANWEVLEASQCVDIYNHKFLILRKTIE